MKNKLILLSLFLITLSQMKGQDYIPMLGDTNVWTYAHWPWEWVDIITVEDTVYNEKDYKKVLHQGWDGRQPYGLTGLIREDTIERKVWYIEPDSLNERIIYDFSLNEGDSIWLQWNGDAYGFMLQDGWYFIDSVRIKDFYGTNRRVFYLDNPLNEDIVGFNSYRPYIEWIEGVGSNLHPVYFLINDCAADFCGIWFVYGASVLCAYKNNIHIYQDCMIDFFYETMDCFSISDISDINNNSDIYIYPNPAINEINVINELNINRIIVGISDISGKHLKTVYLYDKNNKIDISYLKSGLYYISFLYKNKIETHKLLIIKNN